MEYDPTRYVQQVLAARAENRAMAEAIHAQHKRELRQLAPIVFALHTAGLLYNERAHVFADLVVLDPGDELAILDPDRGYPWVLGFDRQGQVWSCDWDDTRLQARSADHFPLTGPNLQLTAGLVAKLREAVEQPLRVMRREAERIGAWQTAEAMPTRPPVLWLLRIEDFIEPEIRGPYFNDAERLADALALRDDDPEKRHGLFRVDVTRGMPTVTPFSGAELDPEG